MKKGLLSIIAFSLVFCLSLSIIGCGGGEKSLVISKDKARDIGDWTLEVIANSGDFGIEDEVSIQELLARDDVNLVFVDFWATWCEPCKASMPYLDQVYQEYKDQGVAALLISVDVKNDTFYRRMMDDLDHLNVSYPIPWDYDSAVKNYLGVGAIPASFLVDKEGKIRYEHTGFTSEEIDIPPLREAIDYLLEEINN